MSDPIEFSIESREDLVRKADRAILAWSDSLKESIRTRKCVEEAMYALYDHDAMIEEFKWSDPDPQGTLIVPRHVP